MPTTPLRRGARELFAALLLDRLRVLDTDHADTLSTRNCRA
jgi:hypothetical protein